MQKKNPKKRDCPALGKVISRGECGAKRISEISCAEDCPFNPFAAENYTQLLEIEDSIDKALMQRLGDEEVWREEVLKHIERSDREVQPDHSVHDFIFRTLFHRELPTGRTIAVELLESGKLKNDQEILLRAKQATRVALIEVRTVLDDLRLEVVDLLRPETGVMTVYDRSFASSALRFDVGLCWLMDMPHSVRISGAMIPVTDMGCSPLEALRHVVRHLGGPADGDNDLDSWLLAHVKSVAECLSENARERARLEQAALEAQLCKATYRCADASILAARLDTSEALYAEDGLSEAERNAGYLQDWSWLEPEGEGQMAHLGRSVLGRVLLGQNLARLEASSRSRFDMLKQHFEALVGEHASFVSERIDELGKQLAAKTGKAKSDLLVPALLENLREIVLSTTLLDPAAEKEIQSSGSPRAMMRGWLDSSLPVLDGATPREAAEKPDLRPKLCELVKSMIRQEDREALESGRVADTDWYIDELGLEEIRFPAPPLRAIPEGAANRLALEKPHFEPLPWKKLSLDEAFDRFDRVGVFLEELVGSKHGEGLPPIAIELLEITLDYSIDEGIFDESEANSFQIMILPLLVFLFGWGRRDGYEWDPERIGLEIEHQIDSFGEISSVNEDDFGDTLDGYLERSQQPGVLRASSVVFVDFMRECGDEHELSLGFSVPLASALIELAASARAS